MPLIPIHLDCSLGICQMRLLNLISDLNIQFKIYSRCNDLFFKNRSNQVDHAEFNGEKKIITIFVTKYEKKRRTYAKVLKSRPTFSGRSEKLWILILEVVTP